jgi:hypothetical protein
MTQLDEPRGAVVRFNMLDAAVAIVILLLIPLAYAAYLLFRTPAPTLASVSPSTLYEGRNQRLEIDGANLRPFLRVSFDTVQARSFLLGSTKYALVDVPDLKPGAYDVVLFDHLQEVSRLPKALTVVPLVADVELEVVGAFKPSLDGSTPVIRAGDRFPPTGYAIAQVVSVGEPSPGTLRLRVGDDAIVVPLLRPELPATLRVKCYTARKARGTVECLVPGSGSGGVGGAGADEPTAVMPDALLTLPSPAGPLSFQISAVHAPSTSSSPANR